jgi:hypothetical protein
MVYGMRPAKEMFREADELERKALAMPKGEDREKMLDYVWILRDEL